MHSRLSFEIVLLGWSIVQKQLIKLCSLCASSSAMPTSHTSAFQTHAAIQITPMSISRQWEPTRGANFLLPFPTTWNSILRQQTYCIFLESLCVESVRLLFEKFLLKRHLIKISHILKWCWTLIERISPLFLPSGPSVPRIEFSRSNYSSSTAKVWRTGVIFK